MKQVKGTELSYNEQQKALDSFIHRFTRDHKPIWANKEWKNGKPYPLQFGSDKDWLEHTLFFVTKSGKISKQHKHCESSPTWPDEKV